jgi:predicted Zn finger-like uncharacterized protein
MKLDCPSCGSGYEVSASLFAAGPRRVRCRACGTVFEGRAAESLPPERSEAPPKHAPTPAGTRGDSGARDRAGGWAGGWAGALPRAGAGLALGLVAGAAAALLLLPGAPAWLAGAPGVPEPLRRLAAAIDVPGLSALAPAPPAFAVALDPVRRAGTGAGAALEVAGEIRNLTAAPRPAPMVELTLLDAAGRALGVIRLPAEPVVIAAGGRSGFSTVALNPPNETARIAARIGEGPLDRL